MEIVILKHFTLLLLFSNEITIETSLDAQVRRNKYQPNTEVILRSVLTRLYSFLVNRRLNTETDNYFIKIKC